MLPVFLLFRRMGWIGTFLPRQPDQHVIGRSKFLQFGIAEPERVDLRPELVEIGRLFRPDCHDDSTLEVDAVVKADENKQEDREHTQDSRAQKTETAHAHEGNLGVVGNEAEWFH